MPVVLKVMIAVSGGHCDYSLRASISLATPLIVCEFCLLFVYPSAISSLIISQYVNRMPRERLPRIMKHYSPTGRRNRGRPLKRLQDTWDRNGSTSGLTPWQTYDYYYYYYYFSVCFFSIAQRSLIISMAMNVQTMNYAHTAFVCVCSIVFLPQRERLYPIHPTPHGIPNGNTSCFLGGRNWIITCVRKVAKGDY